MIRLLALGVLAGCGFAPECGDEIVSRADSPGGRHTAVVFVRNCGATTDFNTNVAVLPAGTEGRGAREDIVFVADADNGRAPEGPGGGPEVRARWRSADTLEIDYHPAARTYRQETSHRGVWVWYRPQR
jgi:hypothetical protein